jgi:hypothetical protein
MMLRRLSIRLAAAVGHHERLAVGHTHETWLIAARRAIEAARTAGGKREERRRLDEGAGVIAILM